MADSESTTTLTRRSALAAAAAGLAGLATGAAPTIAAAEHPDAELRRLWELYLVQAPRSAAAHRAFDQAAGAYEAARGPCPRNVWPPDWYDANAWRPEYQERERLFEAWGAAYNPLYETLEAIKRTPAETLFGVGVKLAARCDEWEEWKTEEAVALALADINRLTGSAFKTEKIA